MIAIAALTSLLVGTALACAADRMPAHVEIFERSGGALLLAGLALIGSGLPFVP